MSVEKVANGHHMTWDAAKRMPVTKCPNVDHVTLDAVTIVSMRTSHRSLFKMS